MKYIREPAYKDKGIRLLTEIKKSKDGINFGISKKETGGNGNLLLRADLNGNENPKIVVAHIENEDGYPEIITAVIPRYNFIRSVYPFDNIGKGISGGVDSDYENFIRCAEKKTSDTLILPEGCSVGSFPTGFYNVLPRSTILQRLETLSIRQFYYRLSNYLESPPGVHFGTESIGNGSANKPVVAKASLFKSKLDADLSFTLNEGTFCQSAPYSQTNHWMFDTRRDTLGIPRTYPYLTPTWDNGILKTSRRSVGGTLTTGQGASVILRNGINGWASFWVDFSKIDIETPSRLDIMISDEKTPTWLIYENPARHIPYCGSPAVDTLMTTVCPAYWTAANDALPNKGSYTAGSYIAVKNSTGAAGNWPICRYNFDRVPMPYDAAGGVVWANNKFEVYVASISSGNFQIGCYQVGNSEATPTTRIRNDVGGTWHVYTGGAWVNTTALVTASQRIVFEFSSTSQVSLRISGTLYGPYNLQNNLTAELERCYIEQDQTWSNNGLIGIYDISAYWLRPQTESFYPGLKSLNGRFSGTLYDGVDWSQLHRITLRWNFIDQSNPVMTIRLDDLDPQAFHVRDYRKFKNGYGFAYLNFDFLLSTFDIFGFCQKGDENQFVFQETNKGLYNDWSMNLMKYCSHSVGPSRLASLGIKNEYLPDFVDVADPTLYTDVPCFDIRCYPGISYPDGDVLNIQYQQLENGSPASQYSDLALVAYQFFREFDNVGETTDIESIGFRIPPNPNQSLSNYAHYLSYRKTIGASSVVRARNGNGTWSAGIQTPGHLRACAINMQDISGEIHANGWMDRYSTARRSGGSASDFWKSDAPFSFRATSWSGRQSALKTRFTPNFHPFIYPDNAAFYYANNIAMPEKFTYAQQRITRSPGGASNPDTVVDTYIVYPNYLGHVRPIEVTTLDIPAANGTLGKYTARSNSNPTAFWVSFFVAAPYGDWEGNGEIVLYDTNMAEILDIIVARVDSSDRGNAAIKIQYSKDSLSALTTISGISAGWIPISIYVDTSAQTAYIYIEGKQVSGTITINAGRVGFREIVFMSCPYIRGGSVTSGSILFDALQWSCTDANKYQFRSQEKFSFVEPYSMQLNPHRSTFHNCIGSVSQDLSKLPLRPGAAMADLVNQPDHYVSNGVTYEAYDQSLWWWYDDAADAYGSPNRYFKATTVAVSTVLKNVLKYHNSGGGSLNLVFGAPKLPAGAVVRGSGTNRRGAPYVINANEGIYMRLLHETSGSLAIDLLNARVDGSVDIAFQGTINSSTQQFVVPGAGSFGLTRSAWHDLIIFFLTDSTFKIIIDSVEYGPYAAGDSNNKQIIGLNIYGTTAEDVLFQQVYPVDSSYNPKYPAVPCDNPADWDGSYWSYRTAKKFTPTPLNVHGAGEVSRYAGIVNNWYLWEFPFVMGFEAAAAGNDPPCVLYHEFPLGPDEQLPPSDEPLSFNTEDGFTMGAALTTMPRWSGSAAGHTDTTEVFGGKQVWRQKIAAGTFISRSIQYTFLLNRVISKLNTSFWLSTGYVDALSSFKPVPSASFAPTYRFYIDGTTGQAYLNYVDAAGSETLLGSTVSVTRDSWTNVEITYNNSNLTITWKIGTTTQSHTFTTQVPPFRQFSSMSFTTLNNPTTGEHNLYFDYFYIEHPPPVSGKIEFVACPQVITTGAGGFGEAVIMFDDLCHAFKSSAASNALNFYSNCYMWRFKKVGGVIEMYISNDVNPVARFGDSKELHKFTINFTDRTNANVYIDDKLIDTRSKTLIYSIRFMGGFSNDRNFIYWAVWGAQATCEPGYVEGCLDMKPGGRMVTEGLSGHVIDRNGGLYFLNHSNSNEIEWNKMHYFKKRLIDPQTSLPIFSGENTKNRMLIEMEDTGSGIRYLTANAQSTLNHVSLEDVNSYADPSNYGIFASLLTFDWAPTSAFVLGLFDAMTFEHAYFPSRWDMSIISVTGSISKIMAAYATQFSQVLDLARDIYYSYIPDKKEGFEIEKFYQTLNTGAKVPIKKENKVRLISLMCKQMFPTLENLRWFLSQMFGMDQEYITILQVRGSYTSSDYARVSIVVPHPMPNGIVANTEFFSEMEKMINKFKAVGMYYAYLRYLFVVSTTSSTSSTITIT